MTQISVTHSLPITSTQINVLTVMSVLTHYNMRVQFISGVNSWSNCYYQYKPYSFPTSPLLCDLVVPLPPVAREE